MAYEIHAEIISCLVLLHIISWSHTGVVFTDLIYWSFTSIQTFAALLSLKFGCFELM